MTIPPLVYRSSAGVFAPFLASCPSSVSVSTPDTSKQGTDKENQSGLRTFQVIKIGLMSIVATFAMSSITHSSFRRTLPFQILLNSLEAIAVTALYKEKIPLVNDLMGKIYHARHPNDPQRRFEDLPTREKERALPYMAAFVTALAGAIQMAVSMKQGKMRDETLQPVSQQKLLQSLRTFSKNLRANPQQGLKQAQRLVPILNQYIQGLAPLRAINKSPVLAVLLTCITSAFFGFIEAKAATSIADKVRNQ